MDQHGDRDADATDGPADAADGLTRRLERALPDASGPVHVLATTEQAGAIDYEISASRLVALDPDDPALADVFVAVPVTGHVSLASDGTSSADLAPLDEATTREARAWARSLIATGAVAGITAAGPTYGPPQRATHELVEDASGRRVLRRIGFALF